MTRQYNPRNRNQRASHVRTSWSEKFDEAVDQRKMPTVVVGFRDEVKS